MFYIKIFSNKKIFNKFHHSFISLRDLDNKKMSAEVFGELRNVVLEKIKLSEKVTSEQVVGCTGEKTTVLSRKAN